MTDSQATSFGDSWLILGVIAGILLVSMLIYFIWWLIVEISEIQKGIAGVDSYLKATSNRSTHQPPSQSTQRISDDSLRKLGEASEAAKSASSSIKIAAEELRLSKVALESALYAINLKQSALDNFQSELDELRKESPLNKDQIKNLSEELRLLKNSYEDEQRSRAEFEIKLETANELVISKGQHIDESAYVLSNVRASLTSALSRRDELDAENINLTTSLTEIGNRLSETQNAHDVFLDWVISSELRVGFPDEINAIIANKNSHELLAALAVLKDSESELCEETFVLANVRHLGSLLVYHYKSQGLDATKREEKLRKWADFVNGKVSGRGQVVVPGLRFPVNAAAMVAPDGVRLISDVHCWLVNNSKGGVYSLAKVS